MTDAVTVRWTYMGTEVVFSETDLYWGGKFHTGAGTPFTKPGIYELLLEVWYDKDGHHLLSSDSMTVTLRDIPLPAAGLLFATGLVGLGIARRRRRK